MNEYRYSNMNFHGERFLMTILFTLTLCNVSESGLSEKDPVIAKDICLFESFKPQCQKNEVILMKDATYGRMKIGRCITAEEVAAFRPHFGNDPRYLGCSSNVLEMLDGKCSGNKECEIRVSDIPEAKIQPCLPGLKIYLEISYICISIADEQRSCTILAAKNPVHVIGLSLTHRLCGTRSQPWIVEAPTGQKVNLILIDLFAASFPDQTPVQNQPSCLSRGMIVDKVGKKNVSICADGEHREKQVLVSTGNSAAIVFDDSNQREGSTHKFLLKIEAVGCLDVIPPEDTWLKRNDDSIVIGCYSSRQTWQLICKDGNWAGVLGNCSDHGKSLIVQNSEVDPETSSKLSNSGQDIMLKLRNGTTTVRLSAGSIQQEVGIR